MGLAVEGEGRPGCSHARKWQVVSACVWAGGKGRLRGEVCGFVGKAAHGTAGMQLGQGVSAQTELHSPEPMARGCHR